MDDYISKAEELLETPKNYDYDTKSLRLDISDDKRKIL